MCFQRVFHNTDTLDSSPLNWERETHPSTNVKVLHDMFLPCDCLISGYLLIMATMRCELVSTAATKTTAEHVNSSSQICRNVAPWSVGLSRRKSFFCGAIAFRCGQTARSPDAKKKKKKKKEHTFSENEVFREKWVAGGESRRRDK